MSSYNSRGRRGRTPPDISHLHSIMVFNISYRTRKEELYRTFDRFGDIADVYIPRDRHGESRGFGFVRFYDKRDAEDAKSMDGRMVDGRRIGVQMAKYGRRHEQSGYRGGGYNNHRRNNSYSRSRSRSPRRGYNSRSRSRSRSGHYRRRYYSRSRSRSVSNDRYNDRENKYYRRRSFSRSKSRSPSNSHRDRNRMKPMNTSNNNSAPQNVPNANTTTTTTTTTTSTSNVGAVMDNNNNNSNTNWDSGDEQPAQQPQYGKVKIAKATMNNDLDRSDGDNDQQQQQPQAKKKKRKRTRNKNKNKNNANAESQDVSNSNSSTQSPNKPITKTVDDDSSNVQDITEQLETMKIEQDKPRPTMDEKPKTESKANIKPKPVAEPKKDIKSDADSKKDSKSKGKSKTKSKDKDKPLPPKEEEKKEEVPTKKKKKNKKVKWDAHDPREHLNLVLIGHVDAGKSTISGQILLATNQIDQRTIAKYKKEAKEKNRESWWIAYIMDEDDEERNKGKTVECGRAHFDTETKRYTILDAPGHKNYVPNMISGAQQADVAIMVISARRGEFEAGFDRGGQTREHGLLAITLGISRIVVVVNKMDTCKWKKDRYDEIKKRVTKFLVDDIGYKKKYIDFLPISGQTATNIKEPVSKDICSWWEGMTLLQTLDGLKKVKRATGRDLRVPILDRYKGDKGLQAIGKVEAGIIKKGETVMIMPTESTADIVGISIDDTPVESAGAGENVLITFDKGALNFDQIYGGCVLCHNDNPTKVVEVFIAEIYIHELPGGGIMTSGYQAMFHCHNVNTSCEVDSIPHKLHKKTMKRSKIAPPFLRSHDRAIARIKLDQKCALEAYEDCQSLGRFTLRDQGKTVVIGKIIEVIASKSRLKHKRESKSDR